MKFLAAFAMLLPCLALALPTGELSSSKVEKIEARQVIVNPITLQAY
jgi:hypothetical protein